MNTDESSIIKPKLFSCQESQTRLALDNGSLFGPIEIAYETYGELNAQKNNAILVLHAFTGSAHAAGNPSEDSPGWWSHMIGPGLAIDTTRFFVICPNVLGSCYGTTGPSSINPETGKAYGLDFPVITINDMVRAQHLLIEHLQIPALHAVIGGSMGGMQALSWALNYPEMVKSAVILASTARST
ncbi:MAG: alpha/beta fold hydrolase, partial [Spirochaetaceae bacterium]